jgi:hypothetical protein
MTVSLEAPPTRSASLTTSQLSNQTLAATLTTVDFDDAESVANAVDELLQWRQQAFRATS